MNALVKMLSGVQSDAAPGSRRFTVRDWLVAAMVRGFPPVLGLVLFILAWQGVTTAIPILLTPAVARRAVVTLFADPFYRNGPNNQGVGWSVSASLARVGAGFGMVIIVGIPTGFPIGRSTFLNAMASSIISLLQSISPLAWLPIDLLLFRPADPAAIWTIFICSIWPMVINTTVGMMRVPQDYLNVARALNPSEWKVLTRVLLPVVLSYTLTGVRLPAGATWLVIVAAEMLIDSVGIGFWLWDGWNNLKVKHIIIAIFVIGVVGSLLEYALLATAQRFPYDAA